MSSKFSIRPAPRKRPWICKASPPALPVPSYPPSLYATLYLFNDTPGPPAIVFDQTLLLIPAGPTGPYSKTWSQGGNLLQLNFAWGLGDDSASATAAWMIGVYIDNGTFPAQQVSQWPKLSYAAFEIQGTAGTYRARLRVTN